MGKTSIILLALLAIATLGLYSFMEGVEPHQKVMFSIWKNAHSKQYDNPSEE